MNKWLSFRPVIFVLFLYRVISKQTCLDTSGLSEHAFLGNLYSLSPPGTDDYILALNHFDSRLCHALVVLVEFLHIPDNSKSASQASRVYPCG